MTGDEPGACGWRRAPSSQPIEKKSPGGDSVSRDMTDDGGVS